LTGERYHILRVYYDEMARLVVVYAAAWAYLGFTPGSDIEALEELDDKTPQSSE